MFKWRYNLRQTNGGCWVDSEYGINACKDTCRGRVCECPSVNGVQYQGDGYTFCKLVGPGRCTGNNGGCWSDIRDGTRFSACSVNNVTGCSCPQGFRGDGHTCNDINECQERLAFQCNEFTCNVTTRYLYTKPHIRRRMRCHINILNSKVLSGNKNLANFHM
ncbi:putative complement Clr-like EGF domain-containing protein [Helianthus annuus]|uniref:Complement Clr-like EGF domain-containing protein n=1 Tax=Helianthus annuus TaxID=4232 RepID=A0A9K3NVH1_HELAN|nr:putative complement Clr-like EGF domain-containing protein [Helianthus annuus]KAJ0606771.1 putative complement Clr-like EGF domain-containing protein [Helianthus annuus]KAJ0766831.1 putative complement Clr-like EGF domain-containing protein [Helianthus annuus]KAJ0934130.1 putative complement Clr-like EGF domain-containing protein [Helianthus annuus]